MEEPYKIFIAVCLGAFGVGYIIWEFVKDTGTEITLDKLAALPFALLVLLFVCFTMTLEAALLSIAWLIISVGMIWFGDELGSNTGFGLLLSSRQTPGFLVRILGWLSLAAPTCWLVGAWILGY